MHLVRGPAARLIPRLCVMVPTAVDGQHLTLLVLASKLGRVKCLKVILDEFNASINQQVGHRVMPRPRLSFHAWLTRTCHAWQPSMQCLSSKFTATLMAAYSGHEDCLRELLVRGGDPRIPNKCVWCQRGLRTCVPRAVPAQSSRDHIWRWALGAGMARTPSPLRVARSRRGGGVCA